MLPTTYRGSATVDGEQMEAELRLDDSHLRLALANGHHSELLCWPITHLQVKSTGDGDYVLKAGQQSFRFAPLVDDGLRDEIELRARFAALQPQADIVEAPLTVADRVSAAGAASRGRRRSGVLTGADLGVRSAIIVLAILALVVVTVAIFSGGLGSAPEVVAVGDDPLTSSPDSLPFTEGPTPDTTPAATSLPAPATTTATPTTIPPPTVTTAPQTTTTAAPTTTTPPTTIPPVVGPVTRVAFDLTPQQLAAQWDSQALTLGTNLVSSELSADGSAFSFSVGEYVVITGNVDTDGQVSSVTYVGDPSGTVSDDRAVLSALGLTVAMIEPSLPPDGRRQLIEGLGLDVDDPVLEGLDGSLPYKGIDYALHWDAELARLVLEARPEGSDDPEASNLNADALSTM